MEYWNGATWEDLTIPTQTYPFDTTEQINSFTFTVPGDWALKTLSGTSENAYYIRTKEFGQGFPSAWPYQISLGLVAEESVPEFSDYLYMITLAAGGWYVFTRMKKFQPMGGGGAAA